MRKRSIIYSQRLTTDHDYHDLFRRIAGLFGYEMISSTSESKTVQLLMEGGKIVLFCDEELYFALIADRVAAQEDLKSQISVVLIGAEATEVPAEFDNSIDGFIPLSAKALIVEYSLFNIFQYVLMKDRYRSLSGKTDPDLIKQLLTKTAHAVNNILTGMQGYSELAQIYPNDKTLIQDSFDVVLDSSQRIKNEIRRLQAFARIESPMLDQVSIAQTLDTSVRLAESRFKTSRVGFDKSINQDFLVAGDYDQLVQVFYHLLSEVTTFCDAGGSVRISISSMDKKAIITIMGVRCIIDDETRSLLRKLLSVEIPILDVESKEGRVETHNVLTLCSRIVRNHGGDLLLGREAKNKLIFRVKLPVLSRLPEAGEVEKIPFEQVYDLVGTLDMDILVVDDEEYVRNTLYYFFARKGCRVTLAEDGEFGLKVAKEKHFDIIFMDYLMPKMGGIEAARKIREGDREVKIVVITGREPLDEDELHRTGIYACIKKPFEIKELYTIAKKAAIESGIIE